MSEITETLKSNILEVFEETFTQTRGIYIEIYSTIISSAKRRLSCRLCLWNSPVLFGT